MQPTLYDFVSSNLCIIFYNILDNYYFISLLYSRAVILFIIVCNIIRNIIFNEIISFYLNGS